MFRKIVLTLTLAAGVLSAQQFNPALYGGLKWRSIGPFRGGRTFAAAGVPSEPNVFYIGLNNGGVWKTDDYGRTWTPIFDSEPTGSIGYLAIAPSDPNIIYVGSGEGLHRPDLSVGDGIYKSTDAGKTWTHLGLRDAQQIASIIVDPRDPNKVFVAAMGHPYGPNPERGVFLSTDGGRTFRKALYKDENTGAMDLAFDPKSPDTVYASLWDAREGPWENGAFQGANSGLFKSTDGGKNWQKLAGGLPTEGVGRINIGIAPSDPNRIYARFDAGNAGGFFRSNDAGTTWQRVNTEPRIIGRGSDLVCIRVDPKNPDKVYSTNTSTYRSMDGGKTFTAIKGAPGGDDYHSLWINPNNGDIMLLAADQGATLTVNGGRTWSSWYNQPTAQFYHVITDNRFPYWVYGGQQESGSAAVLSRGNNGAITFRDWRTVGAEEYSYIAPDPLNPDITYGGKVSKYDWKTGEVQEVGPGGGRRGGGQYRFLRTAPLLFSPIDPHTLYLGAQVVLKTTDGAKSWQAISPDLSRETYEAPPSVGVYSDQAKKQATRRGVVYTIAPSYKDIDTIWAGTDDGLIHVTRNGGKTWNNVTPPEVTPWSKVSIIDAGRFDNDTAYAAINRFRCDDQRPYIFRTHDGGKTWQKIVKGLPDDPINSVKEDPVRKGLLFAGSERAVYVSFNDGDEWQPLRLNMPAISIRDLVIHENDLVVGTHGRGFWILDDIAPLRQVNSDVAASAAYLYAPSAAYELPRNVNTDTPLPPEEPAGKNPPDGGLIYYWLKGPAAGPVTVEILDGAGKVVRQFASTDKPEPIDPGLNVPTYWVRPPQILSAEGGMHRFVWDLRLAPPASGGRRGGYPISAIYQDTPAEPLGAFVAPGQYTVRLTVEGKTLTQSMTVKADPRQKSF